MSFTPLRARPLAPLTSLGLGGPAEFFAEAGDRSQLCEALAWAAARGMPAAILGGGTNLVVSDAGVAGLVVRVATRGIQCSDDGEHVLLAAEAGEPWQNLVDAALARDLAGIECLTGIPGSAGATPIQNVGAYGQEIADTLLDVDVLDRQTLQETRLTREQCVLRYRDSRFKHEPERFVVLGLRLRLRKHGAPTLRYAELSRALAGKATSLQHVAEVVRALRAAKSMLLDPQDENGRSAGSFFKNPIVSEADAARIKTLCVAEGLVRAPDEVPSFPAEHGVKLAAAFLIERAGVAKGLRRGAVGVSTKHTLALVHHGGGQSSELLALAREIRERVAQRFGVSLELEPVCWGVDAP
jgi:UDP-N-acetylmuramate dehydrogenase